MISVFVCGWFLRGLVSLFGMDTFTISAACYLPDPVLVVLDEYIKEVPV